jgi:signal transduction histidine kinase
MKDASNRMIHLTNQLLAYAEGGKYQAKALTLSDFVRDTLPLIEHTLEPSVYVETDLPYDIMEVEADPTQMQMVLSAIFANSSEAMEDRGRIRISCRNTTITDETAEDFPELKPGPYICMEIQDDGKGMDEETRNRIFEPFFTTKFQGRGLGMAAVYGIVKNHQGWVSVDSESGVGTTVRIYLPVFDGSDNESKKMKTEPLDGPDNQSK